MSCEPAGAGVGRARTPVIKASRSDGDFSRVCATDPSDLALMALPTTKAQVERIICDNRVNLKKVSDALILLASKADEQDDSLRLKVTSITNEISVNRTKIAHLKARLNLLESVLGAQKPSCCQRLASLFCCGGCKS